MMLFKKENLKKVFVWFSLFFLMVAMVATIYLVKQRQELRRGAAGGAGEVHFRLAGGSAIRNKGEEFTVKVRLSAASAKQLTVAGADLEFDQAVFEASVVECDSAFGSSGPKNGVVGDKISLTCYRYTTDDGPQTALLLDDTGPLTLGTFKLKVKPNASLGDTTLSFARTRLPDATTFADIADQGASLQFTIGLGPTATPRPTNTPGPTATPGPTNTPGVPKDCGEVCVITSECKSGLTCRPRAGNRVCWAASCPGGPTNTPPVGDCDCSDSVDEALKAQGDGNCDGVTNILDYNAWLEVFVRSNQAYLDFADFDCNDRVTIDDFEIWRDNFSF